VPVVVMVAVVVLISPLCGFLLGDGESKDTAPFVALLIGAISVQSTLAPTAAPDWLWGDELASTVQ